MIDAIKPYLRPIKQASQRWRANRMAARPSVHDVNPSPPPAGFIVGCGRSGTTILGKMLSPHPEICYLFEPYHIWAAIDQRTDVTNLHYTVDGLFIMDAALATPEARRRFNRVVYGERAMSGRPIVIEKTPHNVARIGYLDALSPGAKYLHIVRSGIDIARSIERLATRSEYKMVHKPAYNQWWGLDSAKWRALSRDGVAAGYLSDEVPLLQSHAQRGAYEWLVSLGEADRWRGILGPRLMEITYPQLTSDARGTLIRICEFFGASAPTPWLARASAMIENERRNKGDALRLPPVMRGRFNELMARYGFEGRAEALIERATATVEQAT